MKKILENTAFKITYGIIKAIITIVVVAMLLLIVVQKFSNNNLTIAGYRVFNIVSESMKPTYDIGDVLIAKEVKPNEVQTRDVLVYMGKEGDFYNKIVTHRVENVFEQNGKYSYQTKGDNNDLADPPVDESQIYGIIVYKTVFFSFLGKAMSSAVGYFGLFVVVSILVSFQIVEWLAERREENEEPEENTEEN